MNKAILMGRLTKDPEKTSLGGISKCSFTVAVERRYTNADGERETDFLPCVAWRGTADFIAKYFRKGMKIAVVGSIQTRTYDAQDGSKRFVTEIMVDEAEFVERKSDGSGAPAAQAETSYQQQAPAQPHQMTMNESFTEVDDNDLPF